MKIIPSQKLAVELTLKPDNVAQEIDQFSSEEWLPHVNKGVYQGNWEVLPLRCQASNAEAHPILQAFNIQEGDDWVDLPALKKSPIIKDTLRHLHCELKAVRLLRLEPGASIAPHSDAGLAIEFGEARLHIPMQTNEDVAFYSDGVRLPMKFSELWYVNADLEHAVYNRGEFGRVNLVIDCVVNDWLLGLINQ